MPTYDVLVYHDLTDNLNNSLHVGDDAGATLGNTFDGLTVGAIGSPIHGGKTATVVLAHTARPMRDVQAFLDR